MVDGLYAQSVAMVRSRLGYMQQAINWWWETDEGRGVDFIIHPCGTQED